MKWPAYPRYRDSGVEWLGDVPDHWVVDRVKWSVASSQNGTWGEEADGSTDDIRCVRVADFDRPRLRVQDRDVTYRKVTPQERRGRLLTDGDLILEKSGGGEKNPVGFMILYDRDEPAVTSNFLARVSLAPEMEPRFWSYVHSSMYRSRLTQPSIKQTSGIQNLDQQGYFNERACFPPFEEQRVIADWLDAETAKIDVLIAKQEQLIATLREDRTATITQAVTMGLDHDAQMRNSGDAWIGFIPSHWDAVPMKRTATRITDGAHISPDTQGGVYDFVSTKDISDTGIDFAGSLKTTPASYEYLVHNGCKPEVGDLLFSKDGTVGRTVVVTQSREFVVASSLIIIKCDVEVMNPWFAHYSCQSANVTQQVDSFVKGAGLPRLSIGNLRKVVVARPPIESQLEIVDFLNGRCSKIDSLIAKATGVIDTLREYRSALITDAVTGKIDVRGAA